MRCTIILACQVAGFLWPRREALEQIRRTAYQAYPSIMTKYEEKIHPTLPGSLKSMLLHPSIRWSTFYHHTDCPLSFLQLLSTSRLPHLRQRIVGKISTQRPHIGEDKVLHMNIISYCSRRAVLAYQVPVYNSNTICTCASIRSRLSAATP